MSGLRGAPDCYTTLQQQQLQRGVSQIIVTAVPNNIHISSSISSTTNILGQLRPVTIRYDTIAAGRQHVHHFPRPIIVVAESVPVAERYSGGTAVPVRW